MKLHKSEPRNICAKCKVQNEFFLACFEIEQNEEKYVETDFDIIFWPQNIFYNSGQA